MAGTQTFVGRADELRLLKARLNDAITAGPRVVSISGEPGVGKSTLVDRFLDDVGRRRSTVTVLRAACYQDVSVPYLPLATALRPIGDIAGLLRPLIDDTPERSDERRLHLYVGAADVVQQASTEAPLLLVVDDLQWADQGTLDLLAHLLHVSAQATGGRPLLVVLPHRPVIEGPVAEFTARLRRADWYHEIELQGLDVFSLHELVEQLTGQRPARRLLEGLEEASAGNPLLARSLLERLEHFGVLTLRNGYLTHRGGEEILAGPAELDEMLRHRLRDLSRPCQDLIVVAALMGEGEDFTDVRAVLGTDESRFHGLVEEAVAAGVLRDHAAVRFDHPQVRQVMAQRPRGARRQQLHLRIADHLESLGDPDPSRAVAIAHHLRRSGALADPDRVVRASVTAANHAAAVVAWGEAARAYDAAIEALQREDAGPGAFRALLHSRSAYAHWYNHDNPAAEQHARAAVEIAKHLGDLKLWADALQTLAHAMWSGEAGAYGNPQDLTPFDEYLTAAGDLAPGLQARVHRVRGTLSLQIFDVDGARRDFARAEELVDADDLRAIGDVEFARAGLAMSDLELDGALRRFRHSRECALATGNELQRVSTLRGEAMALWATGDLPGAADAATSAMSAAVPIAAWAECSVAASIAAGVALARGCFDDAEALCIEAERLTRWAGYPPTMQMVHSVRACARATQGDFSGAHAALDDWALAGTRGVQRFRSVVHAMAGDHEAVPAWRPRPIPDPVSLFDVASMAAAVEIGDIVDDQLRIAWGAAGLATALRRGMRFDLGWAFFVPRLAAVAAARLGDVAQATEWFELAASEAARAGAAAESERITSDRARLLGATTG
jgi:hypothetical protein